MPNYCRKGHDFTVVSEQRLDEMLEAKNNSPGDDRIIVAIMNASYKYFYKMADEIRRLFVFRYR